MMEWRGEMEKLTAAEVAQIWAQYLNDSASICMLSYLYDTTDDEEIRELVKTATL